ncbi:uncharacterized protein PpBr36_10017 [Pyricularia pennisetigena]|uniref:uncharacterized protein n=1 Tax=Pyricularia pennisetigena TaxID=1578925 RepID=UPI0011522205|nr:uncharacterized protein PpBr36_10017 [Pyricularia pennisetigena]TLS22172.1 hypothetical protein PpBr36_10017 [Pyricularia pennisetigena]
MRAINLILSALLPAVAIAAPTTTNTTAACTNPQKRVEFRKLTAANRQQYVDAIFCMSKKPSELGMGLNTTRLSDFTYVHALLNNEIHFVAQFLPWHRWFLYLYEQDLRKCGYEGPLAYWDWTLDHQDLPNASIWDPVSGIGGDGVVPQGVSRRQNALADYGVDRSQPVYYFCVGDGPFKDLKVEYKRSENVPHCLTRNFNNGNNFPGDMNGWAVSPSSIASVMAKPNYDEFRQWLEGLPHGAIHSAISGDMGPSSSPNDPVFYLHHAQVDRLWLQWQQQSAGKATEYGGRRTQDLPEGQQTSALTDVMEMLGLGKNLAVADVMSVQSELLCYEYV